MPISARGSPAAKGQALTRGDEPDCTCGRASVIEPPEAVDQRLRKMAGDGRGTR